MFTPLSRTVKNPDFGRAESSRTIKGAQIAQGFKLLGPVRRAQAFDPMGIVDWKYRGLWLGTLFFLGAAAILGSAPRSNAQSTEESYIFQSDELSGQGTYPFRRGEGTILSVGVPNDRVWNQYKHSIEKFPSTKECLTEPEPDGRWDLRNVNWKVFSGNSDIEVCLFHIASTLGPPEKLAAYLKELGYSVEEHTSLFPDARIQHFAVSGILPAKIFESRVVYRYTLFSKVMAYLVSAPESVFDHALLTAHDADRKMIRIQSVNRGY